jgi:hypothetical protein
MHVEFMSDVRWQCGEHIGLRVDDATRMCELGPNHLCDDYEPIDRCSVAALQVAALTQGDYW